MDEQRRGAVRVVIAAPFREIVGIHERTAEYADELDVCGVVSTTGAVIEQTRLLQPDVLLLSEGLGVDPADAASRLAGAAPATRIVVLARGRTDSQAAGEHTVVGLDAPAAMLRTAVLAAVGRQPRPAAPVVAPADEVAEDDDAAGTTWFWEEEKPAPGSATAPVREERRASARPIPAVPAPGTSTWPPPWLHIEPTDDDDAPPRRRPVIRPAPATELGRPLSPHPRPTPEARPAAAPSPAPEPKPAPAPLPRPAPAPRRNEPSEVAFPLGPAPTVEASPVRAQAPASEPASAPAAPKPALPTPPAPLRERDAVRPAAASPEVIAAPMTAPIAEPTPTPTPTPAPTPAPAPAREPELLVAPAVPAVAEPATLPKPVPVPEPVPAPAPVPATVPAPAGTPPPLLDDRGTEPEIEPIVEQARKRVRRPGRTRADTVLVFSGKGGVGKSVVATNLGVALSAKGAKVAVIDLNLQYGDVGVLLHVEAHPTSIESLAQQGEQLDRDFLEEVMTTGPEEVRILLAPASPEFADLVTAASLRAILRELSRTYDYVIVDSPAHLEERILEVMEVADQILVVTSFNITSVKDTKVTLKLLQSLGIERDRVAVVLNQTHPKVSFPREEIEKSLRFQVLAHLPYDPRIDDTIDNGRPMVISEPRSEFTRQLRAVVDFLTPDEDSDDGAGGGRQRASRRRLFGR